MLSFNVELTHYSVVEIIKTNSHFFSQCLHTFQNLVRTRLPISCCGKRYRVQLAAKTWQPRADGPRKITNIWR